VDVQYFGEVMITSGLVLVDEVKWISFHSGYDFGYLLKLLTCTALPANEGDFFELLKLYFPFIYDIKVGSWWVVGGCVDTCWVFYGRIKVGGPYYSWRCQSVCLFGRWG
jgi:hypothetical protein